MTLDFIRTISAGGHKIYMAETTKFQLCRYSNCVKKNFIISSPRFFPKSYIDQIEKIIINEKIDLFIPAWEDIMLVSKHLRRLNQHTKVLASPFSLLEKLHNKNLFIDLQKELGIPTPKTRLVTSIEDFCKLDMRTFALKACYCRGSQSVLRWDNQKGIPPVEISENEPWVAQEWLSGSHYCTFGVCHEGELQAHSIYPMDFVQEKESEMISSIGSYCLSFRSVDHEGIQQWVENFVKKTNFTGLIAFDFIETLNHDLYAIDCNPRITSGATLFAKDDGLDKALLGTSTELVTPGLDRKRQLAIGMLMYGWQFAWATSSMKEFIHNLVNFKDLIFHTRDIKPFVMQPVLWAKYCLQSLKLKMRLPAAFTHDIDYNGE